MKPGIRNGLHDSLPAGAAEQYPVIPGWLKTIIFVVTKIFKITLYFYSSFSYVRIMAGIPDKIAFNKYIIINIRHVEIILSGKNSRSQTVYVSFIDNEISA